MNDGASDSAALVRADVLVLLREKRYEEALARLYQARAESPDSVELQKGIEQVKEFLVGAYAKRLGGLDQVARPIAQQGPRSPDVVLLSRYIDGATTYGDIAEMCPLGKLRTLQLLVELYARPAELPKGTSDTPRSESRRLEPSSDAEEPVPETRRSYSSAPPAPASSARPSVPPTPASSTRPSTPPSASALPSARPDDPNDQRYREAFARGTAAYIQHRFAEAVEAFELCLELRPGDRQAEVMLRRSRQDLESRV